jgi:hypothetical protein
VNGYDNTDPHGLFQYLGTEYVPDDFFDGDTNEAMAMIIEKMRSPHAVEAEPMIPNRKLLR